MNTSQEPARAAESQEVGAPPVPDVVRPPVPVDEHVRQRIQELLRTGRYQAAQELRLRLAEAGDISAVRDVVVQLRREGHYRSAAQLERAVPGSEGAQQVLRWLRQGSLRGSEPLRARLSFTMSRPVHRRHLDVMGELPGKQSG